MAIALLSAGCRSLPEVPPVNDPATDSRLPGQFVWYDLVTLNPDQAKAFYGPLFGWEFETVDDKGLYTVVSHDGRPIAGMIDTRAAERAGDSHPQWLSFMSVDDVDAASVQLASAGGLVDIEAFDLPNRGRVATVFDNRRALLGLVASSSGDPPRAEPVIDRWLWTELWSDDVAASSGFYEGFVDYDATEVDLSGEAKYTVFWKDGRRLSGMVEIPDDQIKPNWLPYVAVEDPAAVEARVVELGGRVLVSAEAASGGRAAILADPAGAAFGVHRWPIDLDNYPEETQ